jgi:hypothetical protein
MIFFLAAGAYLGNTKAQTAASARHDLEVLDVRCGYVACVSLEVNHFRFIHVKCMLLMPTNTLICGASTCRRIPLSCAGNGAAM